MTIRCVFFSESFFFLMFVQILFKRIPFFIRTHEHLTKLIIIKKFIIILKKKLTWSIKFKYWLKKKNIYDITYFKSKNNCFSLAASSVRKRKCKSHFNFDSLINSKYLSAYLGLGRPFSFYINLNKKYSKYN